jgi:hypothetical protein
MLEKVIQLKLHLRRGHILLIAGGVISAISFAILGYYGTQFVNLQDVSKYAISPNGTQEIRQFTEAGQGAYFVAIPESAGQTPIKVTGPAGDTILDKRIEPPFQFEVFPATTAGNYTLLITNPSSSDLEIVAFVGDQQTVASKSLSLSSTTTIFAFSFLLIAGIVILAAGAIITILDMRRIQKMKQFGDTSDLV